MYVKIHKSKDRHVVAVCDEDLIGKKFETKKLVLNVSERFYKGEKLSDEETYNVMKNALNLNIVGKRAIKLAIKNDIIEKENIIKIKNIPHAQVYQLQ